MIPCGHLKSLLRVKRGLICYIGLIIQTVILNGMDDVIISGVVSYRTPKVFYQTDGVGVGTKCDGYSRNGRKTE